MSVIQCPYCELKFATESDLKQHIAFDHPDREIPPEEV
jgi:sarcosine oxidase delta subunit